MAYVLGFFAADGSMTKNKRGSCFIEFSTVDKSILEDIKRALDLEHIIASRNGGETNKVLFRLQIGSKDLFEDLLRLGMTSSKSKTLKFPTIPKKYLAHFVRGYFDGDGNVYGRKYQRKDRKNKMSISLSSGFTSGSRVFLEELQTNLVENAFLKGGSLHYRSRAYRLYYSMNDSKKLYDFMYKSNESLYLERKKNVFEKYISMVE